MKSNLEDFLINLDDLKYEVKGPKLKCYEQLEFLNNVFKGNDSQVQVFLSFQEQFKQQFYSFIKKLERGSSSKSEGFTLMREYQQYMKLINQKVIQYQNKRYVQKIKSQNNIFNQQIDNKLFQKIQQKKTISDITSLNIDFININLGYSNNLKTISKVQEDEQQFNDFEQSPNVNIQDKKYDIFDLDIDKVQNKNDIPMFKMQNFGFLNNNNNFNYGYNNKPIMTVNTNQTKKQQKNINQIQLISSLVTFDDQFNIKKKQSQKKQQIKRIQLNRIQTNQKMQMPNKLQNQIKTSIFDIEFEQQIKKIPQLIQEKVSFIQAKKQQKISNMINQIKIPNLLGDKDNDDQFQFYEAEIEVQQKVQQNKVENKVSNNEILYNTGIGLELQGINFVSQVKKQEQKKQQQSQYEQQQYEQQQQQQQQQFTEFTQINKIVQQEKPTKIVKQDSNSKQQQINHQKYESSPAPQLQNKLSIFDVMLETQSQPKTQQFQFNFSLPILSLDPNLNQQKSIPKMQTPNSQIIDIDAFLNNNQTTNINFIVPTQFKPQQQLLYELKPQIKQQIPYIKPQVQLDLNFFSYEVQKQQFVQSNTNNDFNIFEQDKSKQNNVYINNEQLLRQNKRQQKELQVDDEFEFVEQSKNVEKEIQNKYIQSNNIFKNKKILQNQNILNHKINQNRKIQNIYIQNKNIQNKKIQNKNIQYKNIQTKVIYESNKYEYVNIPQQLKIKNKGNWQKLYRSGKYECNILFYRQLIGQLQNLELFEYIEQVNKQKDKVQQINKLSETYSKVVQQQQQEQISRIIKQIQIKIMQLNGNIIKQICQKCLQAKGQSLSIKIYKNVIGCYGNIYQPIFNKIIKNIKHNRKKLQIFIQVGIIAHTCKSQIFIILNYIKKLIQKIFIDFQQFRNNIKQLMSMNHKTIQQIVINQKFICYIQGIIQYYKIVNLSYQVLKTCQGTSNIKFKLNKIRIQLNNIINQFNSIININLPPCQQDTQKIFLQSYFHSFLNHSKYQFQLCPLCFTPNHNHNNTTTTYHIPCANIIKAFKLS